MKKERISKLQKWILVNYNNQTLTRHRQLMPHDIKNKLEYWNTSEVYYNYFGIKEGVGTFPENKYKTPINYKSYKVPNKYTVILTRSLLTLERNGYIEIPFRAMRGRGHLIYLLTEKGKEKALMLSKVSNVGTLINNKVNVK